VATRWQLFSCWLPKKVRPTVGLSDFQFTYKLEEATLKKLFILSGLFLSNLSFAHTGHDHAHWMSNSIHIVTGLAIISVVAVAGYAMKRHRTAKKIGEK